MRYTSIASLVAVFMAVPAMPSFSGVGDCSPVTNSTGFAAVLTHVDSDEFVCSQLPELNWSQLIVSPTTVDAYPFMGGNLCVNPYQMMRAAQPVMTSQFQTAYQTQIIDPGGTLYFQVFYRDPGFGFGANLSSLEAVTFAPPPSP